MLRELDQWTRRRLRAVVWMQWKRGTTRYAELRRCGVGRDQAAQAAGSPRGPWRLSSAPHLPLLYRTPHSNRSALQLLRHLSHSIYRTAVYGPVCTVVWEGRSRETPPYPDTAVNRIGRAGMLAPDRQKRPGERRDDVSDSIFKQPKTIQL